MSDLPAGVSDYAISLGMGEALIDRLEAVFAFWQRICPADVEEVFVSEYVGEDGQRQYESAFFFAPDYIMEAHRFVTSDVGDIARLADSVYRVEIDRRDFAFDEATASSRLTVGVSLIGGLGMQAAFKASGSNCVRLQQIVEGRLLPHLTASV